MLEDGGVPAAMRVPCFIGELRGPVPRQKVQARVNPLFNAWTV